MRLSTLLLILTVMAIAAFKGVLVVDHFMGLRLVRGRWRGVLYGYLAGLAATLSMIFVWT